MNTEETYPILSYFPYQMAFHEYYDPVWYEKSDYEIYNPDGEKVKILNFFTSENQPLQTSTGAKFLVRNGR